METIAKRVEIMRMNSESASSSSSASSTNSQLHNSIILYPETLTAGELIAALKQRMVDVGKLDKMTKDDLVNLAYRFCVPRPQRQYREDTRRGKVMNSLKARNGTKQEVASHVGMDYDHTSLKGASTAMKRQSSEGYVESGVAKKRKHSPIKFP